MFDGEIYPLLIRKYWKGVEEIFTPMLETWIFD
jgi:hypothetical protein